MEGLREGMSMSTLHTLNTPAKSSSSGGSGSGSSSSTSIPSRVAGTRGESSSLTLSTPSFYSPRPTTSTPGSGYGPASPLSPFSPLTPNTHQGGGGRGGSPRGSPSRMSGSGSGSVVGKGSPTKANIPFATR